MACPDGSMTACNSDGDELNDVAELRASRDPDGSRDFDDCLKYGCGASTVAPPARQRAELSVLWLVAALGAVAATRRARR